ATTTVAGREITISGLADTQAEEQALLAALGAIPGVRNVQNDLSVLPVAAPYSFELTKADGSVSAKGHAPTTEALAEIEGLLGNSAAQVSLASGAPEGWVGAIAAASTAIEALKEASLEIADERLTLRGLAALPDQARAIENALGDVPENFTQSIDIDIEDDGRPFFLNVEYSQGGGAVVAGKLPVTSDANLLAPLGAVAEAQALTIARIPGRDPDWEVAAKGLVEALTSLDSGSFALTETSADFTGIGTRAGIEEAERTLATLPDGLKPTARFQIADDGLPIQLTAEGPDIRNLTGKLPFGTTPEMLSLNAFEPGAITVAEIGARSPAFVALAAAGLNALGSLTSGTMRVEDGTPPRLEITGTMELPLDIKAIEVDLADAPGELALNLTPLDDGTPFRLLVEKSDGAQVASGKVPPMTEILLEGVEVSPFLRLGPEGFEDATRAGLNALAELPMGRLSIEGTSLSLSGSGTRAALSRALASLSDAPSAFAIAPELAPLDDGLPLGLTAEKVGDTVTLIGKMPFGSLPSTLGLEAFGEAMIVSEVDARAPDFTASAQAGLRALAALESGRLVIRDADVDGGSTDIILSGGVTRAGLSDVNAAFADLPDGIAPVIDVVFADDGTPMRLTAVSQDGEIVISGKLPFGSTAAELGLELLPDGVEIAEIEAQSPDFLDLAAAGLASLATLEFGELFVEELGNDPNVSLSGAAASAEIAAAVRDALTTRGVASEAISIVSLETPTSTDGETEDLPALAETQD
ncbi:MAG: BON domain-containing protein, partial [Pseudomonadota bacterium]